MRKILLISNCPLEANQGSGYVICGYTNRMREHGHAIEMFGPDDYIWLPQMFRLKRLRLLLGYTWIALKQAISEKYDVIELWGGPGWLAALLLSLFPKRKFVLVARSNGLEPHYAHVMKRGRPFESTEAMARAKGGFVELGFRRCDALTVVSRFDEVYGKAKGYLYSPWKTHSMTSGWNKRSNSECVIIQNDMASMKPQ